MLGASQGQAEALSSVLGLPVIPWRETQQAEAVVALATDPRSVSDLVRRSPGAKVVLATFDRRKRRAVAAFPGRVKRDLRRAGFDRIEAYWAKPRLPEPNGWIPLGSATILRWYLETRLRRRTALRRWGASLALRSVRPATWVLELVAPAYAVVAVRSGRGADELGVDGPVPAAARAGTDTPVAVTAVVAGGEGPWSRLTFMPFPPGAVTPARVVKAPRLPAYNDAVRNEQEVLRSLAVAGAPIVSASVPQALGTVEHAGLVLGIESYVQGTGLHLLLSQWPQERVAALDGLRLASDWLLALAHTTAQPMTAESLRQVVLDPLDEYDRTLGRGQTHEHELLAATIADANGWPGGISTVLGHRDFGPWNVLIERERLLVIDWENARPDLPLADLVYLLMHSRWLAQPRKDMAHEAADLPNLLADAAAGDDIGQTARDALRRHLTALGLERRSLRPILVTTLVHHALDLRHRILALGGDADDATGNRYAMYLRYLANAA